MNCLECHLKPVKEEGEVCSYPCYERWINRRLGDESRFILLDDDDPPILPLEMQPFYLHTWRER